MKRYLKTMLCLLLVLAMLPMPVRAEEALTEEVVYQKIIALKEEYPEGTPWTNDNFYAWNGGIYSGGYGCAGFAFMLSDAAFGDLPATKVNEGISNDMVRVGDILRVNEDTHSVIVLEVYEDHVVIAEGNYNDSVHWGRTLTAEEVSASTYLLTRYPEEQEVHTHELTLTPAKAATCTEKGNNAYYTCNGCGKVFKDAEATTETTVAAETLPLADHKGGTATCTAKAACEVCGASYGETLEHTYETTWTTDAEYHWHKCADCDAAADKAAHTFEWVIDQEPTAEAAGSKHEECACGYKRNENTSIDKLDHTHTLTKTEAAASTCTTEGNNAYYTCNGCGKVFKDEAGATETTVAAETLPLADHKGGTATCAAKAVCEVCEQPYGEMLEHTYETTWTTDDVSHWHKCASCGAIADKADHSFTWVTDQAATEEAEGIRHEECTCGFKRNENTPIDKLDHAHKDITHHEAVEVTCLTDGQIEYWTCGECGKLFSDEACTTEITEADLVVKSEGHKIAAVEEVPSTCAQAGTAAHYACSGCDKLYADAEGTTEVTAEELALELIAHTMSEKIPSKDATCEEAGNIAYWTCEVCEKVFADKDGTIETTMEKVTVEATGHSYDEGVVTLEPTATQTGTRAYTCANCGDVKTEKIPALGGTSVTRISGNNRCETAFHAADRLKAVLGIEKFDTIILASGGNYADALAGSYLAAVKNAPILLYRKGFEEDNRTYIAENLAADGTVYILGGTAAVPADMEDVLDGLTVVRLKGDNRYLTNLAILEEAGITGDRILVATGMDFADCLAASATGLPILMINGRLDKLTEAQEEFLDANSDKTITIIGGTKAVSEKVMAQLKNYGTVDRITGQRREETALNVAKEFYPEAQRAVVAYSRNFPDALCGGPLAYALNCPLLLVNKNSESYAAEFVEENGVTEGYVMGGTSAISNDTVNKVFAG